MARRPLSRRQFLRGAGGLAISLPFLESLAPANAQAPPITPRFLAFIQPNGFFEPVYYPSVEADVKFADNVFSKELGKISGPISEALGTTFDAYRSKMNIYRGLDVVGGWGHSPCLALASARRIVGGDDAPKDPVGHSRSIDVVMGMSKNFYPTEPKIRALRAQEANAGPGYSIDKDSDGKSIFIPYTLWPGDLWQQVFGGVVSDPATQATLRSKRAMIGDLILSDYRSLLSDPRLSSGDKTLVTNFADMLQSLNAKLTAQGPLQCTVPGRPQASSDYWDLLTQSERDSAAFKYVDLMVGAFQCNLTRIGIISYFSDNDRHGLSHESYFNRENQLRYISYSQSAFAPPIKYALQKMDALQESNGKSMLENSLVFWGAEQSAGFSHSGMSMPAITFGSMNGAIKTGYYMDYRLKPLKYLAGREDIHTAFGNQTYNQLLITIMRGMGLQPSDYLQYGDGKGFGSFDLSTIDFYNNEYAGVEVKRNNTLPFISNV